MYNLNIDSLIWRFYLMMLAVIIPFFMGYGVFSLIALPVFLSAMFGLSFRHRSQRDNVKAKEKESSVSAVAE
jgi:hypothetical protein